jgi:hypothetical protein
LQLPVLSIFFPGHVWWPATGMTTKLAARITKNMAIWFFIEHRSQDAYSVGVVVVLDYSV